MNSSLTRFLFNLILISWMIAALKTDLRALTESGPDKTAGSDPQIRVLIVDGRNNHDWEATTHSIKQTLNQSGRFKVNVSSAPPPFSMKKPPPRRPGGSASEAEKKTWEAENQAWRLEEKKYELAIADQWKQWRPQFSQYDVVVNNYNGPNWADQTREDLTQFVSGGGGLVNIHAANNAFRDWPEFNQMLGLGWRKLDQGIRISIDDATSKSINTPSGTGIDSGHGSKHPFVVKSRHAQHPIMKDIPAQWFHGNDELYHAMRGPAINVDILASAFSDKKQRGTGKHEPILWTTRFGDGRVVTNTMGHVWVGGNLTGNYPLHCVGFQTILIRTVQWAAREDENDSPQLAFVDVPLRFPTESKLSIVHPEEMHWTFGGQVLPAAPAAIFDPKERAEFKKTLNPYCLLTPEETIASIELQPGFKLELVVAEPHVQEPVLSVWDGDGRLYVAQMRSYMQDEYGTGTKTLKNGRISRHEDTNGDGHLDRHTVFVDGLNLPRMVLPLDDRIAVTESDSTDVWSYRDTDNDGVADEKILLYQGDRDVDASRSVEHQDSGLFWAIDNWVYLSRGRKRYRFTDQQWIAENIEFDWNQWGMDQDDTGRLFFNDNSHPAKSFQQHPIYWNQITSRVKGRWQQPSLGADYQPEFLVMHSICELGDRGEPHSYQSFTSATGGSVYRGNAFPDDVRGDYFVADPTGHLVRRSKLNRNAGRISLTNAYEDQKSEFIRSTDINFRPVNTHSGPDGGLYVVDMYRGMIQDEPWVNDAMKAFLRRTGLNYNVHHGRIYRVVPDDKPLPPAPKMLDKEAVELVEFLGDPNGWVRDTAQKLIVLKSNLLKDLTELERRLSELARSTDSPLGQVHAMWTIDGIGKSKRELLWENYTSPDWRVREAAIRISESFVKAGDQETIGALARLSGVMDPNVARQLILTLGYDDSEAAVAAIDQTIGNHLDNEVVYLSAMTALYGRKTPLIQKILTGVPFRLIKDVGERAIAQRRWKSGIASWERDTGPPRPLDEEAVSLIDNGYKIYAQLCTSCHGVDGRGAAQLGQPMKAPPLAGSPRVLGQKEALTRILLHGLTGAVDGKEYREVMAPMDKESDEWIAAVASYIRQEWENMASVVRPSDVKRIRTTSHGKYRPWTLEQLERFALPQLERSNRWSAQANGGIPARAIDGEKVAFETQNKPGRWFLIDLGSIHTVTSLVLDSQNNDRYPRGFTVTTSEDGKVWGDPIATGQGESSLTKISFEPTAGRFFKVEQTGLSDHHRWSISELFVYGVEGVLEARQLEVEVPLPPIEELVAMPGEAINGAAVFKLRCLSCHQIAGQGVMFGPELTDVGKRRKKAEIFQSILDPNAVIDPKHLGEMILTEDGKVLAGFITNENDEMLTIQMANNVVNTIEVEAIVDRSKQKVSAMPSGLERTMTTQELVDLVTYLTQQQ